MKWKHSGDLGDLIYCLPIVRYLGGGDLFLGTGGMGRKADNSPSGFTREQVAWVRPLLEALPYVYDVHVWNGEPVNEDLDRLRLAGIPYDKVNLCEAYLRAFDVPFAEANTPWVVVEPAYEAPVVFARSTRYHNHNMPWPALARQHQDAVFVGLPNEHRAFCKRVGRPVPYRPTATLLEMAEVIAGAKLFIGNQSAPYALAEAMKQNTVLEVCLHSPNCIFRRPNARYVRKTPVPGDA